MILLYNITLLLFSVFLLPWLLYRSIFKEKYRIGIRQRLGFYPQEILEKQANRKIIWIHAVSVGEALAVKPLLSGIRKRFPSYQILISTTTLTGYRICIEKIAQKDDITIFFPLDYLWTVKKALRTFHPSLIMLMETELWPNFINSASKSGIPVLLINGRISDRSYTKYKKCHRLMRKVLGRISFLGMQSEKDAERIISMGGDKNKVAVIPSLKYEGAVELAEKSYDKDAIRKELLIPTDVLLITGGSTHPGEEDVLTSAYLKIKQKHPNICLLLAPRHPNRVKEIIEYLDKKGVEFNLRSQIADGKGVFKPVIILDTLGELTKYYAVSRVVFIGKSLCGKGGQNPMEPAAFGVPVIFGKNMSNFLESSEMLLRKGAAIQVNNEYELLEGLENMLENPKESVKIGQNGRKAILSMKGSITKIILVMEKFIKN